MQNKYQCTTCDPFIMIKNCISIHYGKKLQSSVPNGKTVMSVSVLALYNGHCKSTGFNETPMTLQTPQASLKKNIYRMDIYIDF